MNLQDTPQPSPSAQPNDRWLIILLTVFTLLIPTLASLFVVVLFGAAGVGIGAQMGEGNPYLAGIWLFGLPVIGGLSACVYFGYRAQRHAKRRRTAIGILVLFLSLPVMLPLLLQMYSGARQRIAEERSTRMDHVREAIQRDAAAGYIAARNACGYTCLSRGQTEAGWINEAIDSRAWHVLAVQLQQTSPERRQRLLRMAGGGSYAGSAGLVETLLSNGASADGMALGNAVYYCRAGMTQRLLERGAAPRGRYTGRDGSGSWDRYYDDKRNFDDGDDPRFSLLSLAAIMHCEPVISTLLLKHGADPNDIEPVLLRMRTAIDHDDPSAYEVAWHECAQLYYCTSLGWRLVPIGSGWKDSSPETAWVDEAIRAKAWRIVAMQVKRLSSHDRDTLLSAAPTYYAGKPKLVTLLQASGAKQNGTQWGAPEIVDGGGPYQ
ncbi:hypothetical protein [Burkholderia ubonensis]|uniref:hypothetical protein n=1 Tax=Burkholderia ubonensis TaxID=101571 RepID=UPI000BABB769|nr:hypothetical protein [Burkholderia ubonensis]PAJ88671.1 hypothetical protein CJO70_05880 [Burkholderia ubonensis]PAJ89631.1 hypothetical protein CJO69_33770 [Burkholderia ubonensis]PAK09225.1 hypothetical protein CJO67_04150 [Burkholderia ubonensis]RQP75333.1 hypothetical protein DF013_14230 [Burkholderia ubonensis]RQQ12428.1 hypothetical protein DF011_14890 [Burkholderia ubonensis]